MTWVTSSTNPLGAALCDGCSCIILFFWDERPCRRYSLSFVKFLLNWGESCYW